MFGCYSSEEYYADEKLLDIAIESSYVCATSSRFEVLREVQMTRWSRVHFIRQIQSRLRAKWARSTAVLVTLLLVIPAAALAQGSPFDTGFTAIQSLFTGTIAKVASLVAIVIGGYGFAARRTRCKEGSGRRCCRNGHCRSRRECPELALGRVAPSNSQLRSCSKHCLGE
jgi:type IV secretory pathway VirB2 component (pilin)